ncbi:MAG: redoxin domain-containing protein [Desulfuromonadales bacterium]|nr:redoxin domain-containing protein [Desulfuromonadales bacterium]
MKRAFKTGAVIVATLLASKVAALEIGAQAPDFSVESTQGAIELSQELQQGPVVLAYYPADFTPV